MMNHTKNKQIHEEVMRNLGLLYGKVPTDEAHEYATDAMDDACVQSAPEDNEDCSDLG